MTQKEEVLSLVKGRLQQDIAAFIENPCSANSMTLEVGMFAYQRAFTLTQTLLLDVAGPAHVADALRKLPGA